MQKSRDFSSFTAAKRFRALMRRHGIEVRLLECRGLFAGTWSATWKEEY